MKNPLVIFTLLLLAGFFFIAIYPFLVYPQQMKAFCDGINEINSKTNNQTDSILQIKQQAEYQGFRVHDNSKEKSILISDSRTIGKFTCHIQFTDDSLSAEYFAD